MPPNGRQLDFYGFTQCRSLRGQPTTGVVTGGPCVVNLKLIAENLGAFERRLALRSLFSLIIPVTKRFM
jgi:hypothetical protein